MYSRIIREAGTTNAECVEEAWLRQCQCGQCSVGDDLQGLVAELGSSSAGNGGDGASVVMGVALVGGRRATSGLSETNDKDSLISLDEETILACQCTRPRPTFAI